MIINEEEWTGLHYSLNQAYFLIGALHGQSSKFRDRLVRNGIGPSSDEETMYQELQQKTWELVYGETYKKAPEKKK